MGSAQHRRALCRLLSFGGSLDLPALCCIAAKKEKKKPAKKASFLSTLKKQASKSKIMEKEAESHVHKGSGEIVTPTHPPPVIHRPSNAVR